MHTRHSQMDEEHQQLALEELNTASGHEVCMRVLCSADPALVITATPHMSYGNDWKLHRGNATRTHTRTCHACSYSCVCVCAC